MNIIIHLLRTTPFKEPSPPQQPAQEPGREFLFVGDWITIPRKKFPSTCKQKGPNAQQMRNDNNDGMGLKRKPMAEGRDTSHWAQRGTRRLEGGLGREEEEEEEEEGESGTLQT